jgi:hypothetical protein
VRLKHRRSTKHTRTPCRFVCRGARTREAEKGAPGWPVLHARRRVVPLATGCAPCVNV